MGDPIAPALSPDGWREVFAGRYPGGKPDDELTEEDRTEYRHSLASHAAKYNLHEAAAICLYGQPFGFTWEDVDVLEGMISHARYNGGVHEDDITHAVGLAARIAALLPPR